MNWEIGVFRGWTASRILFQIVALIMAAALAGWNLSARGDSAIVGWVASMLAVILLVLGSFADHRSVTTFHDR